MTVEASELEGAELRQARRIVLWGARAVSYLVYGVVLVVEVILGLGFFLLLFGANPTADFADWVYRSMNRAMDPFRGIFTPIELGTTSGNDIQSVFETSVLFAMIVYGVVAIAVHALIAWLSSRIRRIDSEETRLLEQARYEEELRLRQAPPTGSQETQASTPTAAPTHPPSPTASPPQAPDDPPPG